MSSQVLTFVQLQSLFYSATTTAIPGVPVRHAYQGQSQPSFEITDDVIFLNINNIDSPYDKQRDITYSAADSQNANQSIFYVRVIQTTWTIYGPNSWDNADIIRNGVLTPPILEILGDSQVYPIPGISPAIRAPYLFDGQWWQRCDLNVNFNVGTLRVNTAPYLQSAEIELEDDQGDQRIINVT